MLLFIERIPRSATEKEIRQFVRQAISPKWFQNFIPTTKLSGCDIISIEDRDSRRIERHAIVDVKPDKTGLAVIERLNKTLFKGRHVEVRKYFHRSSLRDHRQEQIETESTYVVNLRVRDRRRKNLVFGMPGRSEYRRRKVVANPGSRTAQVSSS